MERHAPDRIALVFGLMFTTVGAVTLAGLADVAEIDGGVALGSFLVVAALALVVVTVTNTRDHVGAVDGGLVPTGVRSDAHANTAVVPADHEDPADEDVDADRIGNELLEIDDDEGQDVDDRVDADGDDE